MAEALKIGISDDGASSPWRGSVARPARCRGSTMDLANGREKYTVMQMCLWMRAQLTWC